MGKGKGAPEFWVGVIKPGRVIFELDGVTGRYRAPAFKKRGEQVAHKRSFVERHEI